MIDTRDEWDERDADFIGDESEEADTMPLPGDFWIDIDSFGIAK